MTTQRIYTKQALSITEQIDVLKKRGLNISDESLAEKILGEVSYFRFIQYLRPMEMDSATHKFKPDSNFEDALALYNFDTELRDLIFKAVNRLEIALRTKIIHEFSTCHGPFWFADKCLSKDDTHFLENKTAIEKEINRSNEDFVLEFFLKYDDPAFPPAWKTMELASLGTLSKIYYNFKDKKCKKNIAREFNIPQHIVLESWMHLLSIIRNCCAHHARIWNRTFPNAPKMNVSLRGAWINTEEITNSNKYKIYPILCCIAYWLDSLDYGKAFKDSLRNLFTEYPQADPHAMGFPKDWQLQPLWRKSPYYK